MNYACFSFWGKNGCRAKPLTIVNGVNKIGNGVNKMLEMERPFLAHFLKENAAGCGALSFPLIKILLGVVKSKIQRLFFRELVTALPKLVTALPKSVW